MVTRAHSKSGELGRAIERALQGGPRTAAQLIAELGISQPTLSRTIQGLSNSTISFRVSGERTPRYALLRQLPLGLRARQRVYMMDRDGQIGQFAEVAFLSGGATFERIGNVIRVYEGLPPYMAFAAPSGFLGRQLAQMAARGQHFPSSLKDWNDDHKVAHLFTSGVNLSGNLVFGDDTLQREMDFRTLLTTPVADKAAHYQAMAAMLKSASYGSSAGGEQPKFLSLTEDAGHVIVKFARLGSRMAQLLPLEHLALRSLAEVGIQASQTQVLVAGEYVFLEVQRFDRVGLAGRIGMLSAGSVDDEFFGARDASWSEFARRCEQEKYIPPEDARRVDIMAAFSELIGNTDRHFENISMLIDDAGEYIGIAPAYDILPMRYAPLGAGIDPDLTPIEPKVGAIGAQPDVWSVAEQAAVRFWAAVQTEERFNGSSEEMRQLAAANLEVVRRFTAPLLPARPLRA